MKNTLIYTALLSILMEACTGNKEARFQVTDDALLDNCPEVATLQKAGNDEVTVLHLKEVKDTFDLPLSLLLEDFRIIPLDNSEEALIKGSNICVSENHIASQGSSQEPYKLFDKNGHFLCQVGNNGQGPGEYGAVYSSRVDEANQRIYLLPWNAKSLLVYDLQGEYLSAIPLPTLVPKGVFAIDTEKQLLTVGLLPFSDIEGASIVWQQDFKGKVLHRVDAAPYAVTPDFSNEVTSDQNAGKGVFDFSIFHWVATADTLYHFLPEEDRLAPVLTLQQPKEKIQHSYVELPDHYLIDLPAKYAQNEWGTYVSGRLTVMVNKQNRRGAYVRLLNDLIGNAPVEYAIFYFKQGYFAYSMEPAEVLEHVEKALLHPETLDDEMRNGLEALRESIRENDNNYLFVGKIRQEADLQGMKRTEQPPVTLPQAETKAVIAGENTDEEPTDTVVFTTPLIRNWKEYYRTHNRYKDWAPDKKATALVGAIIEKDGTPRNLRIIRSSGYKALDEEAIRLVQEADISPALNEAKQPIRCTNFGVSIQFPPL